MTINHERIGLCAKGIVSDGSIKEITGKVRSEMTSVNVAVQIVRKLSTVSMQSLDVASISQTTHSNQPKLTGQTDHSTSFFIGFFLTFVFIGFLLGCFLQYFRYKKLRAKRQAEIFKEVETLNRIEKITPEIDEKIKSQRKQQIETLEKIWKMKP